jgi:hypothetical protein
MNEIVINDWHLVEENEEVRVTDLELAAKLGYEEPRAIRKLIKRMERDGRLDGVQSRDTVSRQRTKNGGEREYADTEYLLSEVEAVLVCTQAKTETAKKVTREFAEVVVAWRKGKLTPPPAPLPPPQPSSDLQALTSMVGQLVGAVASMLPMLMQAQTPAPQVYDPGFPEPRYEEHRHEQRPLRLVTRAPEPDKEADPRWYWLAQVAAKLGLSFEQAQRIVEVHGIPTRWSATRRGHKATQITDDGARQVEQHARRMGFI